MQDDPQNRIDSLEEHLRNRPDKATDDAINDISFYSYRHANRLFKALKGESIKAFAGKVRIQISAEYLTYTREDILDIALAIGYESTAAFSKAFKKLYGQSPSDYRQCHSPQRILLEEADDSPAYSLAQFEGLVLHLTRAAFTWALSLRTYLIVIYYAKESHSTADSLSLRPMSLKGMLMRFGIPWLSWLWMPMEENCVRMPT